MGPATTDPIGGRAESSSVAGGPAAKTGQADRGRSTMCPQPARAGRYMPARPRRSARLDRLVDGIPQAAFVVRTDSGQIAAWNAVAAALFGHAADAAIGQPAAAAVGIG